MIDDHTMVQSGKRARIICLVVVTAILWLSGAGCAMCCSAGPLTGRCISDEMSCNPSGQDCCKVARKQNDPTNDYSISSSNERGCSLLPKRMDARLDRGAILDPLIVALPVHGPLTALVLSRNIPWSTESVPTNRGSTDLRRCVLLI